MASSPRLEIGATTLAGWLNTEHANVGLQQIWAGVVDTWTLAPPDTDTGPV